mmetsp:Transcript_1308/g.2698  ORF Transcript_1308/g.2698 Transcript_1308/m.2698 type:complete len:271 (+) Transcript_1308:60-872(+)
MVEQNSETKPTSPLQTQEFLNGMSTSTDAPPTSPTAGDDDLDAESNKRSERKRRREKQRRSDLSNAFDELAAFLVQVEPGVGEDEMDKKGKKRKSSDGGEDSAGITRLDLIGRALRIMKRLYRENEERKRVIAAIEGRGGGSNDNVIVMVPTLAPSGEESPPIARATYPGSYHHSGANPYYASAAAVVGGSHDPRDYQMPPPPHHAAYASHWPSAAATGYGGRPSQPGLQHHLQPPGVRLPPHHVGMRPPGLGGDGQPGSHMPPGSHHQR